MSVQTMCSVVCTVNDFPSTNAPVRLRSPPTCVHPRDPIHGMSRRPVTRPSRVITPLKFPLCEQYGSEFAPDPLTLLHPENSPSCCDVTPQFPPQV